jgi:hypothetical protein
MLVNIFWMVSWFRKIDLMRSAAMIYFGICVRVVKRSDFQGSHFFSLGQVRAAIKSRSFPQRITQPLSPSGTLVYGKQYNNKSSYCTPLLQEDVPPFRHSQRILRLVVAAHFSWANVVNNTACHTGSQKRWMNRIVVFLNLSAQSHAGLSPWFLVNRTHWTCS